MEQTSADIKAADQIRPPVASVGVIGWIRTNLFDGWLNSLLTLATIYALWVVVPPLIRWAFIDSLWNTVRAKRRDHGGDMVVSPHRDAAGEQHGVATFE